MKKLGLLLILISFLLLFFIPRSSRGEIVSPEDYHFPFKNTYTATASELFEHSFKPMKSTSEEYLKDREQIPYLTGKNKIEFAYLIHDGKDAPLAIVIGGLGAAAENKMSHDLCVQLFNFGYHVLSVPNPFSQTYTIGRSLTALPGYLPRDAVEYYQYLEETISYLKSFSRVRISGYALLGYSYGASLAGFLVKEDNAYRKFNFEKILLINPAVDLGYGAQIIDQLYDPHAVVSSVRAPPGNSLLKKIIGGQFHKSLASVIYASFIVNNLEGPHPAATQSLSKSLWSWALGFNFVKFISELMLPSVRGDLRINKTVADIFGDASMYSLVPTLQLDSRVFIMHNADDFLLKPGDTDWLFLMARERLFLYPYGGHLGNLWYSKNRNDLKKIMAL